MSYRDATAALRHELEVLEAELAELRALPEPEPAPAKPSKKAMRAAENRSRALRSELADLERRIARHETTSATARENDRIVRSRRTWGTCVFVGVLVLATQVFLGGRSLLVAWGGIAAAFIVIGVTGLFVTHRDHGEGANGKARRPRADRAPVQAHLVRPKRDTSDPTARLSRQLNAKPMDRVRRRRGR